MLCDTKSDKSVLPSLLLLSWAVLGQTLVHVVSGYGAQGFADDLCRHASDGHVSRYVFQDYATSANLCPFADFYVADDLAACRQQHATPNLRVAIAAGLARSAEGDRVQYRNVIFDDGGFTDDDACCVVEHNAGANLRGRMKIDTQRDADLILKESR